MPILDSFAKAAKDFFIDDHASAPAALITPPLPVAPQFRPGTPPLNQPEQRHLDHIASLLAGDGHNFAAYTKMVKSMASSGMAGPLLYQTAFNAFAALTGQDVPALLASAEQLTDTLANDRARVQQRHREKLGETPATGAPSAIVELLAQEKQLQADIAELSKQLTDKSQLLQTAQQQLSAERQRADASLASYELAHAAALGELRAHRQAAQSFLGSTISTNHSAH
jgi:hypothetical protein